MSLPAENNQAQSTDAKAQELEKNFAAQRRYYEKQLAEQKATFEQQLAQVAQEKASPKQEYDHDDDSDETYIDKKAFNKKLSSFEKILEQKIDKRAEEKARALLEQERQANYIRQNSDFNAILAPEMIQKYYEKYPEMAETLMEMPEGFARQKKLYQEIKALGLHKPPEPAKPIQETVDKNRRTPYYQPSGIGTSPYAQTGDFSKAGQKSAYDKMMELINNRKAL